MMRIKRFIRVLMACTVVAGCIGITASAQGTELVPLCEMTQVSLSEVDLMYLGDGSVSRSTSTLNTSISANSIKLTTPNLPMDAGETVTINCTYTSTSASMDFGLVAPNGRFYYFNVTSGSINKSILIEEPGTYTLAIRNNSSHTVSVTGTVRY